MADKQFGAKGFAAKHFAQKQFAQTASGLTLACTTAIITRTGQRAAITLGSSRVISATTAIVTRTGQQAAVSRGRTVLGTTAIRTRTGQQATVAKGGRLVAATTALIARQAPQATVITGRLVVATTAAVTRIGQRATVILGSVFAAYETIDLDGFISSGTLREPPLMQSFAVARGSFAQLRITVKGSSGEAIDLSGGTARFLVSRRAGAAPAMDSDDGQSVATVQSPGTNGVILVTIQDTDLAELAGTYAWEAWFADATGRDVQVARGYMTARQSSRLAA